MWKADARWGPTTITSDNRAHGVKRRGRKALATRSYDLPARFLLSPVLGQPLLKVAEFKLGASREVMNITIEYPCTR